MNEVRREGKLLGTVVRMLKEVEAEIAGMIRDERKRRHACTASAPCACAIPDENRTVFVLEADLPLADTADPRPFCRKGEKPYGPAGPADPAHPYETCKPRSPRGSRRR
jgi:hypothetical protein